MRKLVCLFLVCLLTLNAYGLEITESTSHAEIQSFINGDLTENAGISSEWYIFALRYGNYDFSSYTHALDKYIAENDVPSVTLLKYALTYLACGRNTESVFGMLNGVREQSTVMYTVFALHLANNGILLNGKDTAMLCTELSERQNGDGGWSVISDRSDVDVTAMALQALAVHADEYENAVESGLSYLSSHQNENGTFSSYGAENSESTSQVIIALSDLGIDCKTDTRFIKNGLTVLDGLDTFKVDGGYSHALNGQYSTLASSQAMCAVAAYENGGYFYVFEKPSIPSAPETDAVKPLETDNVQASGTEGADTSDEKKDSMPLWRIIFIIAVCIAFAVICFVLIIKKKTKAQNFITAFLACALVICISFFINVSTPDQYYGQASGDKEPTGYVTISVICDNVSDNGIIVSETKIGFFEHQSVYDILLSLSKTHKFTLDVSGKGEFAYIRAINGIAEHKYGNMSGWVYTVNGISPHLSCGAYYPSDNDVIRIYYTTDGTDAIS
ncbi:MAG: DUF4430 domain-containing protein [Clostridia bacterium]|nr:DUF4430 domain-containing protein [Clostridia bacterium]